MATTNHFHFLCIFTMQSVIASLAWSAGISNAFGSTFLENEHNITILDYTGDVAIIQFPNGTMHNLNVPEYSECVAYLVMTEGLPRYFVQGPEKDELLTDNELGIVEAMNECIGVGVGASSMEKAQQ